MAKIEFLESFHSFLNLYHKRFVCIFRDNLDGDLKLGKNQVRFLYFLYRKGEMLPSRLGKILDMEKGSLTTMVNKLLKTNLIERRRDESDKRKTWIKLSEKGNKIISDAFERAEDKANEIIKANLNQSEMDDFHSSISKVINYMEKIQ